MNLQWHRMMSFFILLDINSTHLYFYIQNAYAVYTNYRGYLVLVANTFKDVKEYRFENNNKDNNKDNDKDNNKDNDKDNNDKYSNRQKQISTHNSFL